MQAHSLSQKALGHITRRFVATNPEARLLRFWRRYRVTPAGLEELVDEYQSIRKNQFIESFGDACYQF